MSRKPSALRRKSSAAAADDGARPASDSLDWVAPGPPTPIDATTLLCFEKAAMAAARLARSLMDLISAARPFCPISAEIRLLRMTAIQKLQENDAAGIAAVVVP